MINTTTATDLNPVDNQPMKRKRRSSRRSVFPLDVPFFLSGGCFWVPLQGYMWKGKHAIIDADDWIAVSAQFGPAWGANWNGARSSFQVCRAHRKVATAAGQKGPHPKANLARIITGAPRGKVVLYRDGNPLNLRRSNLEVTTSAEARQRFRVASQELRA